MTKTEQREYELGVLKGLIEKQRQFVARHAEAEDVEQFSRLFEGIQAKLVARESLTDHQWESLQRLYYCQIGTFAIDDIKEAYGY